MKNYTIIHGNVIYKVENVIYASTDTHRTFKRNGVMILSVPLASILVMDGEGVKSQIINGLNTGGAVNVNKTETTVVQSDDNFTEGLVVGGIVGSILF